MNELSAAMKILLANNFVMYFKAQSYHWNIEGIMFSQYHDFFGDLYGDLYGAIDPTAEQLRALDAYAPMSLMELYQYKTLEEDSSRPVLIMDMLSNLTAANNTVIECLNKVFALATEANNQGLGNFIADRLDKHKKHAWQLRASMKNIG
jgi:starvation-inducible DNA-binding protein